MATSLVVGIIIAFVIAAFIEFKWYQSRKVLIIGGITAGLLSLFVVIALLLAPESEERKTDTTTKSVERELQAQDDSGSIIMASKNTLDIHDEDVVPSPKSLETENASGQSQSETDEMQNYFPELKESPVPEGEKEILFEPEESKNIEEFVGDRKNIIDSGLPKTEEKQEPASTPKETSGSEVDTELVSLQTKQTQAQSEERKTYPFTIQIASYDKERSDGVVKRFREKGDVVFTSLVSIPDKGDWYPVFFGFYETADDAEVAINWLKRRKFRSTELVKNPYAVEIGLFDKNNLKEVETGLLSKGYFPYTITDHENNSQFRLLMGAFKNEQEASRLLQKVQEDGFQVKVVLR
jgi:cell division septation protein DedD